MFRKLLSCAIVLSLSATCVVPATADEGLWTLDNFPIQKVKTIYGVTLTSDWLNHITRSAVRLSNGCSASLVSANGLVLTNNHCVSQCAQDSSSAGHDIFTGGFVADDKIDEKQCRKLSAEVILSTTDVTPKITQMTVGLNGAILLKAQGDTSRQIETSACSGDTNTRCQVSTFYGGAQYKLFKYRIYNDVRLVFSPGRTMSHFDEGQAPPRSLDIAFLRIYDNNAPLVSQEHLHWNNATPTAGELVFIAGNPRVSERELTASQLQTERDVALPVEIKQRTELNDRLTRFAAESPENKSASEYALSDSENHTEYIKQLETALTDADFLTQKQRDQANLCMKDSAVEAQFSIISAAEQARRRQALAHQFLVNGPFFDAASSQLFSYARVLVRVATERAKPKSERLSGYADSQLDRWQQRLLSEESVYRPLERLVLQFWLDEAQQSLPSEDPILKVLLDGQTPQELAAHLSESKLSDPALRKQLWAGGLAAIQASDDPMIRYVLRMEPAAQASQINWEETVTGPETLAAAAIAKARLSVNPNSVYPDANGTLRLSFGKIDGFDEDGKHIVPFTTFHSVFHGGADEGTPKIDLRWMAARSRLNPATVLNIFTTNDGINGNSGSPLINARGEVIGVFYGGNSYASAGDYGYDATHNRALAVSAAAVNEAIIKVYGAQLLAKELADSGR